MEIPIRGIIIFVAISPTWPGSMEAIIATPEAAITPPVIPIPCPLPAAILSAFFCCLSAKYFPSLPLGSAVGICSGLDTNGNTIAPTGATGPIGAGPCSLVAARRFFGAAFLPSFAAESTIAPAIFLPAASAVARFAIAPFTYALVSSERFFADPGIDTTPVAIGASANPSTVKPLGPLIFLFFFGSLTMLLPFLGLSAIIVSSGPAEDLTFGGSGTIFGLVSFLVFSSCSPSSG